MRVEKIKTFFCLCCGSPPLSVKILLPVKGYVPGQSIPVRVIVKNQSGVRVERVKLHLEQVHQLYFFVIQFFSFRNYLFEKLNSNLLIFFHNLHLTGYKVLFQNKCRNSSKKAQSCRSKYGWSRWQRNYEL